MRNTNTPSVKNYKRKVALSNLKNQLGKGGYTDIFNVFINNTPERMAQIAKEIATLESRVTR